VALFFMLHDREKLVAVVMDLVPPRWRTAVDDFGRECDTVLGEYLRGQLLVMLALAVWYASGLALFGLDLALPIGVFTGWRSLFPIWASVPGCCWRCWPVCCNLPHRRRPC